jgi:glyoxylase-like metal-dependent hydrolase (beta-lactamase superfamily II)
MAGNFRLVTVVDRLFSENTHIAYLEQRPDCLVIDPGLEPALIEQAVEKIGKTPAAILNTHGHADHIAGNRAIKQRWPDATLAIGKGDAHKLSDSQANLSASFGIPVVSPAADVLLSEPDRYQAAGFDLEVIDTPGHSVGHIVLLWRGQSPWIVFGGDVLFQGSVGRTDFPDGSFEQLKSSIHEKLFVLPDDTIVLSGHGPQTTVGAEKSYNPFVGGDEWGEGRGT